MKKNSFFANIFSKKHYLILIIFFLIVGFILFRKLLPLGQLVYGDIPYFDINISKVNFLYSWTEGNLGTSVRLGANTLRDAFLQFISPNSVFYFYLKYYLPIALIPISYYFCFKQFCPKEKKICLLLSIFPLSTPIFFGDFLTGQSMWPYIVLPWIFYFIIKIYYNLNTSIANSLLLSISCFLCFGLLPPLLIPMVATIMSMIAVVAVVNIRIHGIIILKSYIKPSIITVIMFGLLALPYIIAAPAGQGAYRGPSVLGDYYHNYSQTKLINTFRLAGNAGNGQSTLEYNSTSLSNFAGYGILILIIIGVIISLKQKKPKTPLLLVLMGTLLLVFGFLQTLQANTDLGGKLFQDFWLFGTIRNPTKIHIIILPLVSLSLLVSLYTISANIKNSKALNLLLILCTITIGFYGWPMTRGDFGLFYKRQDKIPQYKPDTKVIDVAKDANTSNGRALLVPADHQDELNYEQISSNLNTLKLEGSMPGTRQLIKEVKSSYASQNPYFFKYLQAAGIDTVYLQKDVDSYKSQKFSLLYSPFDYNEAVSFLRGGLDVDKDTDGYTRFKGHTDSLINSPSIVTYITNDKEHSTKAPFIANNRAVIDQLPGSLAEDKVEQYEVIEKANIDHSFKGIAQLYEPNLVLISRAITPVGENNQLTLSLINPITGLKESIFTEPLDRKQSIINLNGNYETIRTGEDKFLLGAGSSTISTSQAVRVNLEGYDAGFESNKPVVEDASVNRHGTANIYSTRSEDAVEGKFSQLVGAEGHLAYVTKTLPRLEPGKTYRLIFSHKNLRGNGISYSVMQDDKLILSSKEELAKAKKWQDEEIFFKPANDSSHRIYFYIEPGESIAENLLDNLRIEYLEENTGRVFKTNSYLPDYQVEDPSILETNIANYKNLINNGSFEDNKLWGEVRDATVLASGEAKIDAKQSKESVDGNFSLELKSNNHTAFVSRRVMEFKPNAIYKISFYYRNITGMEPSYAIWQSGANIASPANKLEKQNGDWTYFETSFVPDKYATDMELYLYTPSNGSPSINLFDNVIISERSIISKYILQKKEFPSDLESIVTGFKRHSPVLLEAQLKPGNGMVVFNESFHEGWEAYAVKDNHRLTFWNKILGTSGVKINKRDHIKVNGFANGWWIDYSSLPDNIRHGDSYRLIIEYGPQRLTYLGFLTSGTTFLGCVAYLIYYWRKGKRSGYRGKGIGERV